MKVIITGASGFIGQHLTQAWQSCGAEVFSVARDGAVRLVLSGATESDYECEVVNADVFYHLAWCGADAASRNDADKQALNRGITLQALELAHSSNSKVAVFLGSVSQYASQSSMINERTPFAPVDAYGQAKIECQALVSDYAKQHNLPVIWAVPTSIYGPGRDDGNILSYAIRELLAGHKPSFTALEQLWDFIYIDDFIAALVALAGIESDVTKERDAPFAIYPIGTGQSRPLKEYIEILRDSINPQLPLGIGDLPYKNGQPDNAILDISKLEKDTDYKVATSFSDGIANTIGYFRANS